MGPLLQGGIVGGFVGSVGFWERKKWPPTRLFGLGEVGAITVIVQDHVTGVVANDGIGMRCCIVQEVDNGVVLVAGFPLGRARCSNTTPAITPIRSLLARKEFDGLNSLDISVPLQFLRHFCSFTVLLFQCASDLKFFDKI
jgi:hypothetical protein